MRDGRPPVTEFEKVEVEAEMLAAMQEDIQQGVGRQGETRGRKHTNQKPPAVRSKDGGTRSTVATS